VAGWRSQLAEIPNQTDNDDSEESSTRGLERKRSSGEVFKGAFSTLAVNSSAR